jgi:hypothetical protein
VRKLASITLVVALGFCAAGFSSRAEAGVVVGVGIGLPGVAVVAPPVIAYPPLPALYAAPYYYRYPRYYYPALVPYGFGYRYGYGFRGYAYGRHWR